MKKKFKLEDLDCANCAAKMEDAIKKIPGVNDAVVSFMTQKMTIDAEDERFEEIMDEVVKICAKVEPDCRILRQEIAYDKESEKNAGTYSGYCSAVCSTSGIGTRWYLRTDYTASPDFYYLSGTVSSDWL